MNLSHLNAGPDHLSQIETSEEPTNIDDGFLDARLFRIDMVDGYYDQIIQFLETGTAPEDLNTSRKKNLMVKALDF